MTVKIIRIAFPQLTEERRKEIVKDVHKLREEAKVAVRNIRRDYMDKLKALKKKAASVRTKSKMAKRNYRFLLINSVKLSMRLRLQKKRNYGNLVRNEKGELINNELPIVSLEVFGMEQLTIPKHIGIIMDGNGRWAKKEAFLVPLDTLLAPSSSNLLPADATNWE